MAKNKQNPILAAFEAKKEAEFCRRLGVNTEINLIATLISGSNLGILGEKRSCDILPEILDVKMQIAEEIVSEDDPELLYTKHNLAKRLKQILGKEGWVKYRELFPLLREYWEV